MRSESLKIMSDQDYDGIIKRIDRVSDELREYVKQNSNPMNEKWIDNADASRILKISGRSLQNYRDKGILPFSTIGGKIYYKASDIEAVLESNYSKRA
jgi:hypothetical protein